MLGELTLGCLSAGVLRAEAEGSAAEDVLRVLMEAWSALLSKPPQEHKFAPKP